MPSNVPTPHTGPITPSGGAPPFARPAHPDIDVTTMPRPGDNQPDDQHVTRRVSRDMPFLIDDDFVWVENLEKYPVEFRWDRRPWVVAPDEGKAVVFQAVVNKLGDPRSTDGKHTKFDDGYGKHGIILERYTELKRLFALYGVEQESIEDFTFQEGPRKGETIKGLISKVPKLRVTTLDGYPLQFPAYDSKMFPFPVNSTSPKAINSDVSRALDELQAENAAYHSRIAELEARMDKMLQAQQGIEAT
jgi:hypothetical protein